MLELSIKNQVGEIMKLVIRPMIAKDIERTAYVHWKAWQDTYHGLIDEQYMHSKTLAYSIDRFNRSFENTLVADLDDQIVGFIMYGKYRDQDLNNVGEIYSLYVLKAYHHQKIGTRLMDSALKELTTYRSTIVWVLKGNEPAMAFYQRYGYEFDGKEKTIRLGTENTELRMIYRK